MLDPQKLKDIIEDITKAGIKAGNLQWKDPIFNLPPSDDEVHKLFTSSFLYLGELESRLRALHHQHSVQWGVSYHLKSRYYVYCCHQYGEESPLTVQVLNEAEGPWHSEEYAIKSAIRRNQNAEKSQERNKRRNRTRYAVAIYDPKTGFFTKKEVQETLTNDDSSEKHGEVGPIHHDADDKPVS